MTKQHNLSPFPTLTQAFRAIALGLTIELASNLTASAGSPNLRFDFESGNLQGWEVVTGAFYQPVRKLANQNPRLGGQFYLTTEGPSLELDNSPNRYGGGGIIESPVFIVHGSEAKFLARGIGGRNVAVKRIRPKISCTSRTY